MEKYVNFSSVLDNFEVLTTFYKIILAVVLRIKTKIFLVEERYKSEAS